MQLSPVWEAGLSNVVEREPQLRIRPCSRPSPSETFPIPNIEIWDERLLCWPLPSFVFHSKCDINPTCIPGRRKDQHHGNSSVEADVHEKRFSIKYKVPVLRLPRRDEFLPRLQTLIIIRRKAADALQSKWLNT